MGPGACAIKECEEEASVPVTLSSLNLVSAGCVTYNSDYLGCCKRDARARDLRLPERLCPETQRSAKSSRSRWCRWTRRAAGGGDEGVQAERRAGPGGLLRAHGIVTPEEPGYVELVKALRQ